MRILWVSHIIPYPPKSGVHLRSYNLLRAAATQNEVDLVAFVQEQWLEIFYASREQAIEDCGRHLRQFCRSVRFVCIENLARPHTLDERTATVAQRVEGHGPSCSRVARAAGARAGRVRRV